jgi:hypothetical protein
MRNKVLILAAMACLAMIPMATAHAQMTAGTGATTVGVINTTPSTTIPRAASNAATRTVGDQPGMKERSPLQTVKCTYAYSQAYGACPKAGENSCTYAQSQAYGSCPKGE